MPVVPILFAVCLGLGLSKLPTPAQSSGAASGSIQKDQVVIGSTKDSMEVRHLVLKGTNEEIGKTLATIAKERYEAKPQPSQDPLLTRAQRHYIGKNYPILLDRMRGA